MFASPRCTSRGVSATYTCYHRHSVCRLVCAGVYVGDSLLCLKSEKHGSHVLFPLLVSPDPCPPPSTPLSRPSCSRRVVELRSSPSSLMHRHAQSPPSSMAKPLHKPIFLPRHPSSPCYVADKQGYNELLQCHSRPPSFVGAAASTVSSVSTLIKAPTSFKCQNLSIELCQNLRLTRAKIVH